MHDKDTDEEANHVAASRQPPGLAVAAALSAVARAAADLGANGNGVAEAVKAAAEALALVERPLA